ncbi:glycosyltransferase family 9 protein [bacterium]|nr:glycosyltransferase family 9 protein [bacterium]
MRIAVIRLSSFGDILCTGPAVRGIRTRFPDAQITYITNPPYVGVAAALPGVDHVVAVERRGEAFERSLDDLDASEPYDKVADLQGSLKSDKIAQRLGTTDVLTDRPPRFRRAMLLGLRLRVGEFTPVPLRMVQTLAPWGVEDDGGSLRVVVPPDARDRVESGWNDGLRDAYVLVPGAKHATKQWPGEYWRGLLEKIDRSQRVVILGAKGELPQDLEGVDEQFDNVIDLTGKTGLLEAAAVLEQAKVLVSGDTGPMHLAVAVGVPMVTLYGPTVREFGFYPFRAKRSVVLEREMWCRPCSAHGSKRCPLGHHRCLREIKPDEVWAAVQKVVHQVVSDP